MEKEGNLGSLQAGAKLWLAASAAMASAWIVSRARLPSARLIAPALFCFGFGVAYIGLDDMMALHERAGFVLNRIFRNGGFYGESFNWLWYFSPFMLLALVTFTVLLRWLKKHARAPFLFLLTGTVLWIMSIAAEWMGRGMIVAQNVDVRAYRRLIFVEEGLEMVGASCMMVAMFLLARQLLRAHVRVEGCQTQDFPKTKSA